MEYKTAPLEIKAVEGDEDGIVEGHYSIFGNVDTYDDRVWPGAFSKTIKERGDRVMVFRFHDWSIPIGPAGGRFLALAEDENGLYAKYKLALSSFWAKDTWALIKEQVVREGSFGYDVVKHDTDDDGVRNLRELRLYEISPVPIGANPLTTISAIKAGFPRPGAALEALTVITDEIKTGRLLAAAKPDEVRSAQGALEATLDTLRELLAAAEPPQKRHSTLLALRARATRAELVLANIYNQ